MSNFNLYQITSAFPVLMENEEITIEEKEMIEKELNELLLNKSMNVIAYIRNTEMTIEAKKSEEKRIAESRKADEKRLENFKKYVKACMENAGITKVETEIGNLSIAKSPISVEIINENEIPTEFIETITTTRPDKAKIKEHFKATGELIDGVIIHTDNTNLRIK